MLYDLKLSMNSLLILFVTMGLYSIRVVSRSVQLDWNNLKNFESPTETDGRFRPKSKDFLFWTKFKSNFRQGVRTGPERSNSGSEAKSSPELSKSSETADFKENFEANVESEIDVTDPHSRITEDNARNESFELINNPNTDDNARNESFELINNLNTDDNARNESFVLTNNLNMDNDTELVDSLTAAYESYVDNQSAIVLHDLKSNVSDADFFSFSNFTDDVRLRVTSFENVSADSLDETLIMTEGGTIAFFQDTQTPGFELLIDSETTRNMHLTELLNSASILLSEDDDEITSFSDDYFFTFETETFGMAEDCETIHLQLDEAELNATQSKNESFAPFSTKKVSSITNVSFNSSDTNLVQTKTEVTVEPIPECPPPGWCVFWFMSQDTCAKDSHCFGSLICCQWGCSKTCIEV